jgi:hypothetical protein
MFYFNNMDEWITEEIWFSTPKEEEEPGEGSV